MLKITKTGSTIGRSQRQSDILRGMGLRRIGSTVMMEDTSTNRGMIDKVSHLIKIEETK